MEVNRNISVSENPNDLDNDIVMITRDIKPGFAKLRCLNSQKNKLYFGYGLIQTHEGLFLSTSEWITRRRHNWWPSSDLIQDIVQDGCLLVPFGNPYSQESHLQWRISFSLAETKLVHSFNHNQYLCYGLLKLFLKHAINSNTQVKDSLCSYFLKTSLFYCIEKENIVWNQENLLDCFSSCLGRLITWIWDENSLNYFIKNNNKIEGKICKSNSK
ncbi:hypothetical protein KUTeg_011078, partial [Tegillarca granosa]